MQARLLLAEPALDALGNPVRRQILSLLATGPQAVGEIADVLPISRPAVSKHLKTLEAANLVAHNAEGTRNLYFLDQTGFAAAKAWLGAFWDDALARFADVAEATAPETP